MIYTTPQALIFFQFPFPPPQSPSSSPLLFLPHLPPLELRVDTGLVLETTNPSNTGFDKIRRLTMATQQEGEASQETTTAPPAGLSELVQERYRKMKEHAETYPYVWASYTLVYGTLALWTIYRYRKLRKTEDRVRSLQERLRKLVENEESANPGTSVRKAPTSDDKVPK
ncbi:hypothetical protein GQ457_07G019160 [Hibiscus cannabinus]